MHGSLDHQLPERNAVVPVPRESYALGHSDSELKRLEFQGNLYRDLTEDVLRRAGLEPGMSVLDIGCGVGDVTLLAADLVGQFGSVIGIDRAEAAVSAARRRGVGRDNVHFVVADLDTFTADRTFDAVIGRMILAYMPDPAATLRRLCRSIRPGGIVAFQELMTSPACSFPEGPQFQDCVNWIMQTLVRAGFEPDMGAKLFATFLAAGLPGPIMISAGRVEGGPQSQVYGYLAATMRSLLPMAERLGVATAAEVDIDRLADRLRREAIAMRMCIVVPPLVGAWARVS
jgi:ubiquinone/menaquinone biosynthesis C-methylase UbiE